MDSNKNQFFKNIESENSILHDQVTSLESEVLCLKQQVSDLEKALDKQKKFHRKFVEEVDATERLRIQDFKEEKSALNNRIKSLVNEKRQLGIDGSFYKKSYEELIKEKESMNHSNDRAAAKKKSSASVSASTISITNDIAGREERSSKVLSKLSEKLLAENKKLNVKVTGLNTTIRILKSKNVKLETLKKKMENKKSKYFQDSKELEILVKSTETNNGNVFNPAVLAKLGQLSTI